MKIYESEDSGQYQYICSAHDDIKEWTQQIYYLSKKIMDVDYIAKEMGVVMETCINIRKSTIEEMQEEINTLKKEVRKYKAADKKRKAAKEKKLDK